MAKVDNRYMAGFVDKSSHIGIRKSHRREMAYGIDYRPIVKLNCIDKKLISSIQKTFGGLIVTKQKCWLLYGNGVFGFLEKIYPYLITKKKIVKILLKYSDAWLKNKSNEEPIFKKIIRREKAWGKIKELKKNG